MTTQTLSDQPDTSSISCRRGSIDPFLVLIYLLAALILAACGGRGAPAGAMSPAERDATIRQIALDYGRDRDLAKAQAALGRLNLANPTQFVVTLAEQAMSEGRPADEVLALARLAEALGGRSPKLQAYLAPTATPVLPTATEALAPSSPTAVASATPIPPTATPAPPTAAPTATATPTPAKPRVVADNEANLRGGPGTNYPIVGKLAPGKEAEIIGRNSNGDWWRIAWDGAGQAWVAGLVVRVLGPIDTVTVVKDIPPPPPTNTPAAPTATPTPAGPDFRLVEVRIWGVEENGGFYDGPSVHCGEKRELHVKVLDAAGHPLNGVTVKAALGAQEEVVTGSKGVPGDAEFVLGGGQEVYIIRDVDGRQVTSDYAKGMSTNPHGIPIPVLISGGYCRDEASCIAFINQNGCYGHYSWTVTFRRNR